MTKMIPHIPIKFSGSSSVSCLLKIICEQYKMKIDWILILVS